MKIKVNGCGALYCRYNELGKCTVSQGIVLGERGECLINKPDIEKMEEQRRVERYVIQSHEGSDTDGETRRIGFYDPAADDKKEDKE